MRCSRLLHQLLGRSCTCIERHHRLYFGRDSRVAYLQWLACAICARHGITRVIVLGFVERLVFLWLRRSVDDCKNVFSLRCAPRSGNTAGERSFNLFLYLFQGRYYQGASRSLPLQIRSFFSFSLSLLNIRVYDKPACTIQRKYQHEIDQSMN